MREQAFVLLESARGEQPDDWPCGGQEGGERGVDALVVDEARGLHKKTRLRLRKALDIVVAQGCSGTGSRRSSRRICDGLMTREDA